MAELPRCRLATWAHVDAWADRVAEAIRSADRIPEVLTGLTRGGWIHARLLADRLGVKRMVALQVAHWGVTATRSGKAELTDGVSVPLEGANVLAVDDITDTGESLSLAVAHLVRLKPRRLEAATLIHIDHSKFVPTYYGEMMAAGDWAWVVFPWNYWEDLRALVPQALSQAGSVTRAVDVLREECGLSIPVKDAERALRESASKPA